jgi:uncharacterized membrane protein
MASENTKLMLRTAGLCALAGMRTMSGPALVSLDRELVKRSSVASRFFNSGNVMLAMQALAVGEMVADKLPFMPKRTWLPSLITRASAGAIIGASIYSAEDEPTLNGAIIGGASAIAATYVSYNIRRTLTNTFHVPDFLVALLEDSIIISRGVKLLERQFTEFERTYSAQRDEA